MMIIIIFALCGMHEHWNAVLLAITLPPWEESHGTPSTPHGNKELPFVVMQVSGFTIFSLLKSQELKTIWIKRFSSLQRATEASATYQPFWQQLFLLPIVRAVSLQQLEKQHHIPRTRSCVPNFQGNKHCCYDPQSMLPAPQIQGKCFIVL